MATALLLLLPLTIGCVDYGLTGLEVAEGGGDAVTAEAVIEPALDCAAFGALGLTWEAGASFTDFADPTDSEGTPFWDPSAALDSFSGVSLPHRDIPVGSDRAYVGSFWLDTLPPGLFVDIQSDDGLWVWVNGVEVGHWGGDWQEEGCVNENAECLYTVDIDPVEVTDLLVPGENRFAARVSNPVANAWFELTPSCVD